MPKNLGVKGYQEMRVRSASPEQLILMLYDGALRFLRQAIKALEEKQLETAHNNLIRTQNILTELIASLDLEEGGKIASNLLRIYEFMHRTLVQANLKKEPEPARQIMKQIKKLRESWATAMKNMQEQQQQNSNPSGKNAYNSAGTENGIKKNIELTG
ncbi:MAG: flagellar export chaperone FliS [Gemmatimonadota bacterium]|nr:flagellar export chaperone FliS [Gemmatimonadota bacterium]